MTKPQFPWGEGVYPEGGMASAKWSYAHDLVNMYLGIAHFADNELSPEEQRTFMARFGQWVEDVSLEQFENIWSEVVKAYDAHSAREQRYGAYLQSVLNVARFFGDTKERLRAVIRDLVEIAGADGKLHENEVTMIKAAAITYGLSADMRVNVKTGRVELTLSEAN